MTRCTDAYRYCKQRQQCWARAKGLPLCGSEGDRGEPAYTPQLELNLFEPLSHEARLEFERGDGEELAYKGRRLPKMHAIHSSAALSCNIFHYWRHQSDSRFLLAALGLPPEHMLSLEFEAKRPIVNQPDRRVFPVDPNLDVAILCHGESGWREIAVEVKFTEPYRTRHASERGLKAAYLRANDLWKSLPASRRLAKEMCPVDKRYKYVHAAQLLKHILGLKNRWGVDGFVLFYMWYDVPLPDGLAHREEIEDFAQIVARDGVRVRSITHQEVIQSLSQHREDHAAYVDYLMHRYFQDSRQTGLDGGK